MNALCDIAIACSSHALWGQLPVGGRTRQKAHRCEIHVQALSFSGKHQWYNQWLEKYRKKCQQEEECGIDMERPVAVKNSLMVSVAKLKYLNKNKMKRLTDKQMMSHVFFLVCILSIISPHPHVVIVDNRMRMAYAGSQFM